jgi:hypothetical protein
LVDLMFAEFLFFGRCWCRNRQRLGYATPRTSTSQFSPPPFSVGIQFAAPFPTNLGRPAIFS